MGEHDALRRAGRSGGVDQRGEVVGTRFSRVGLVSVVKMSLAPSPGLEALPRDELEGDVGCVDRIERDDVLQVGHLVGGLDQLGHLIRVGHESGMGAGVPQYVGDLIGGQRVVDGYADDTRHDHGEIEQSPLVARRRDDRRPIASLEPERPESQREIADDLRDLAVRPRLPLRLTTPHHQSRGVGMLPNGIEVQVDERPRRNVSRRSIPSSPEGVGVSRHYASPSASPPRSWASVARAWSTRCSTSVPPGLSASRKRSRCSTALAISPRFS